MPDRCNFNIPDVQPPLGGEDRLTDAIVLGAAAEESHERFNVSFDYYIDKRCGIKDLENKSHAIKALTWIKHVCQCSDEEGIKSFGGADADTPIANANTYSFLFSKIPEDFSDGVREYKLSRGAGRIFYCVDAAKKLVYCILIHQAHLETDKIKR